MEVIIKWIDGEYEQREFKNKNELQEFLDRCNPLKRKMSVITYQIKGEEWKLNLKGSD